MLRDVGPAAVTRASLARRAKVAPGLIRYYFKNRDSLIRAATLELHESQQKRAREMAEDDGLSPAERITARALALLDFKVANPFYHHLIVEELAKSESPESRGQFHEIASQSIERYRRYLKEGAAEGSLREVDPGLLYMMIISLSEFVVHAGPLLHKELGVSSDADLHKAYGDFMCDILLNGLRPR
jgi:AcrR family transcriptional regulator